MPSDPSPGNEDARVEFTPEFKRNLRRLAKKYRRIRSDVDPVVQQLVGGGRPGNQVPRVGYPVYKVRVANSDLAKGKRSGYRLLYYIETTAKILLVTLYSKSEQGDISAKRLRQIIKEVEELRA